MPSKPVSENPAFRGYWYKAAELTRITDRKHPWFDDRAAKPADPAKFEALCLSIDAVGVEEPLIVAKDDAGRICIIAGNQRHQAAEFVNAARADGRKGLPDYQGASDAEILLPVIFKRDTAGMLAHKGAENTGRADFTPSQRASMVQRLLDGGKSLAEAAATVGLKPDVADRYLKLLDLHSEIKAAVDSGDFAADAALAYASLDKPAQLDAYRRALETSGGGKVNRHAAIAEAKAAKAALKAAKVAEKNGDKPAVEGEAPKAPRATIKPGNKRIRAAVGELDALAKTLTGEEKKRVLAMADALDWAATGKAGEFVAKYLGSKAAEIDTRAPKAKAAPTPLKPVDGSNAADPEL